MFSLKRILTSDQNIQLIQDNVGAVITQLQVSPFQGGTLLENVALSSAGNNAVSHGLTRTPKVWVVCGQNANSVIWATSQDANFLNLSCSANVTVSLWVN